MEVSYLQRLPLNLIMFWFLIISLINLSFSEDHYWNIGNNSITLNSYTSKLKEKERDNYYYWVGLRNSFYFSEDSNQLEKVVKYFTPEEEDYYPKLFNFSVPGFICCGAVIVIFLVYLIKRFLLKGCRGPKIVVKSYHYTTYFFIGFGFISGVVFLSFTIYNCGQSK